MATSSFERIWDFLGGTFSLNAEAFRQINSFPDGLLLSLSIVLMAGLSLAIGQVIILFLNRVRPIRFIFSLLISAVLYVFGFLFLVISSWLICLLPWSVYVPFPTLLQQLGLGYAPLLFSFLGALPYLGSPILSILSVWHLLAIVVGFAAVADVGIKTAFSYVAFGWFVKQLLENTIGQPIADLGKMIADRVAGVNLVESRAELVKQLRGRLLNAASPLKTAGQELNQAGERSHPEAAKTVGQAVATETALGQEIATPPVVASRRSAPANQKLSTPQLLKLLVVLISMMLLFVIIAILLQPIRDSVFNWDRDFPKLLQWLFDLLWVGIVAIVFAGLLAPLESLGWWAGWYGDEVETRQPDIAIASDAAPLSLEPEPEISRYLIYLDGVGQSGDEYTPDVEDFLAALTQALPDDIKLVRGLMMYSVLNKPLDQDRPLAFLWRLADKMRWANPAALLGILVNLRNMLIVAVSADKRYGPVYDRGIAQVLYNGLIEQGYQPGSGIPVTLIGYSGGGEMAVSAAPYLKRALSTPIDAISLGGVMSADNNYLELEHLYHLVGDKDSVERMGPIMFPGRWKIAFLSYWNRAKRKGKITFVSLGPAGHQVPGGLMDPNAYLPDGRTYLQQTIDLILQILDGTLLPRLPSQPRKPSNYALYKQIPWNDPAAYPLNQPIDLNWYRPIAPWMGRLILPQPEERRMVQGVWFEVHHAEVGYEHLVGQRVKLRWVEEPRIKNLVKAVTRDVHFSADAAYTSEYGGLVHPERLNHWRQVGPLESLAGAHPLDDLVVMLEGEVEVEATDGAPAILRVRNQPVQITGRYYALVQFVQPIAKTDQFRVVHFNRASHQFDGPIEIVRLPAVMLAEAYGSYPSTTRDLEKSPLNEMGWYIYGAKDEQGNFVVQSLGPRALFRLQPDQVIFGRKPAYHYIHKRAWADPVSQKGRITSVLCAAKDSEASSAIQEAIDEWQEGDRALVLHTYGGIGGNRKEPAAATPIFFGHFAYGLARVVRELLTGELRFEIQYYQIYTHNTDGLVAGTLHWSRYMGDRQFGWAGTRPVCDILVKLDPFTGDFERNGRKGSALTFMLRHLQVMTARYRIGDGTGGTYVGPANNCSQDSNQALFASLRSLQQAIAAVESTTFQNWLAQNPEQARQFDQLLKLGKELAKELQPFGAPRPDWENNEFNLGSTLEDAPLRNLLTGLGSWRTLLPRLASDTIVHVFLKYGASVWVLRTTQIGGNDPDIEPIAPITL
ncbi:MAG: hypothetical protein Kow00121_04960 [Elainellaceae cyanobacterium]